MGIGIASGLGLLKKAGQPVLTGDAKPGELLDWGRGFLSPICTFFGFWANSLDRAGGDWFVFLGLEALIRPERGGEPQETDLGEGAAAKLSRGRRGRQRNPEQTLRAQLTWEQEERALRLG